MFKKLTRDELPLALDDDGGSHMHVEAAKGSRKIIHRIVPLPRLRGPLSVLKATFDMELQPQVVDLGSSQPGQAEQDVTCYPDLCCSSSNFENVVRVEHAGSLNRLSGRLSLLQEEPTVEVTGALQSTSILRPHALS